MVPNFNSDYYEPFPEEYFEIPPCQRMPFISNIRQKTIQSKQKPMNLQINQMNPSVDQMPMVISPTDMGIGYTQGYLQTQIGKRMLITFLLGTNIIQDRRGTLEKVGISYIIIKDEDTTTSTLCDIYSIKFVVIYP